MNLFIYEHLTGGGLLQAGNAVPPSLAVEGRAMIQALAADFAALDGVRVACLRDARAETWQIAGCRVIEVASAEEHQRQFDACAGGADCSIVIAPEIDGILLDRCRRVEQVGGRLLGPSPQLVALASDKQRTIEHLAAAGVPTPEGRSLDSGDAWPRDFSYPAVWKPRDGAGSQGVSLVRNATEPPCLPVGIAGRLERFCRGLPASVVLLGGPRGCIDLPACRQRLSEDGRLRYLGGSMPLAAPQAERARRLAQCVAASLGEVRGYLGIDVVLAEDASGSDDVVIEINPRLTTSYLGLRALCRQNLADVMLRMARGEAVELSFQSQPISFTVAGHLGGS